MGANPYERYQKFDGRWACSSARIEPSSYEGSRVGSNPTRPAFGSPVNVAVPFTPDGQGRPTKDVPFGASN